MLCFRYKKYIVRYAENALTGRALDAFERHIAKCERCAAEVEAIRAVSDALRSTEVTAMEPASDLWARVSERIEDMPAPRRIWIPQAISVAAAAVLIAAIGLNVVRIGEVESGKRKAESSKPSAIASGTHDSAPAVVPQKEVEIAKALPSAPGTKIAPPAHRDVVASAYRRPSLKPEKKNDAKNEPIEVAALPAPVAPAPALMMDMETSRAMKSESVGEFSCDESAGNGDTKSCARSSFDSKAKFWNPTYENTLALAQADHKAGHLSAAMDYQLDALMKNPKDKYAMLYLLAAYKITGNSSARISMAKTLISVDPANKAMYLAQMGDALASSGDVAKSVSAFSEALENADSTSQAAIIEIAEKSGVIRPLADYYSEKFKNNQQPQTGEILKNLQAAVKESE